MRSWVLMLTALLVTGLCAGPASAQTELDDGVITAVNLGPDQIDAIDRFVEYYEDGLTDEDPNKRSRARNALLAPLGHRGVSVDFRMRYSDRLMPDLERVVSHEDFRIAINGLRIAGALATQESTQLLIDSADDEHDDVRYVSAWGIKQTFEEVERTRPAITQGRLRQLLNVLELRLGNEDEPYVFDVVGRALTVAGKIDNPQWRTIRKDAQLAQATVTAQRVRSLNPGVEDAPMLRAVARTIQTQLSTIQNDQASDEVAREAAGLAGQVMSYAAARARAGDLDDTQRLELQDLVKRAEALIYFARITLDPVGTPQPTKLADLLAEGGDPTTFDDSRFADEVVTQLIGPDGALCQPPLEFSPSDFAR